MLVSRTSSPRLESRCPQGGEGEGWVQTLGHQCQAKGFHMALGALRSSWRFLASEMIRSELENIQAHIQAMS